MTEKHHILVVAPRFPYPPDDGHKVRNWNLLRHMGSSWTFDFISFSSHLDNTEDSRGILGPSCIGLEFVDTDSLAPVQLTSIFERIKNIYYPYELTSGLPMYSKAMEELVNARIESRKYDLVFFCGFSMYLYCSTENRAHPSVVDIIDSFSLLHKTYFQTSEGLKDKIRAWLDYIWAVRYEKNHFSKADNMILVSPIDKECVKRSCDKSRIWVVPNGVDTSYFEPDKVSSSAASNLLFSGVMNYRPNHESMVYFIENVFPLIRQEIPNVTLTIAGKDPLPELHALVERTAGVVLTGYVEDIRPYFDQASVYIAPMISGAGLKNKILEAWSMGKPVVATNMACYGIEAIHGKNILKADKPNDIARQTISLIQDEGFRARLSSNARQTVIDLYSWNRQSRILEGIFEDVLRGGNS